MSRRMKGNLRFQPFKAKHICRGGDGNSRQRQVDVYASLTNTLNKPKLTPEQLRLATGDDSIAERASQ